MNISPTGRRAAPRQADPQAVAGQQSPLQGKPAPAHTPRQQAAPGQPAAPQATPGVLWGDAAPSYTPAYGPTPTGAAYAGATARRAASAADPCQTPTMDPAPALTRRLVAAEHPMGVRQVVSEAGTHLLRLRVAAALNPDGEEGQKAKARVRKLETLLRRANRKIKGLEREARLRQMEQKARHRQAEARSREQAQEEKEQEAQARQVQKARSKQKLYRRSREQRYLLELTQEELLGKKAGAPARAVPQASAEVLGQPGAGGAVSPVAGVLSEMPAGAGEVPFLPPEPRQS